jgi:hypothetical protein
VENQKNFIKIFDEQIAVALSGGGFSYVIQNFNDNQTLFAFEETPELREALEGFLKESNFQADAVYVEDTVLNF